MDLSVTKYWVAAVFVSFVVCELYTGRFVFRTLSRKRDVILDVLSNAIVPILVAPTVLFMSNRLTHSLLPESKDVLASMEPLVMFGILLLADDLTQYFWHRLSHSSWLYPLHRAHHSANYLSVRVVYRNNLIYYMLMPGLWLSGALIYCGLWAVYPIYGLIKMTVIIAAHSSVPWDEPLYTHRLTKPLMWIVERVISTPSTHSMHHGLHESDGVTHYKGNYGNLLFLWDIVFGTARISRRRPKTFGVENLEPVAWQNELLFPRSAKATTTIQTHRPPK